MSTVFITGSRGIQELEREAKQALDKIMSLGFNIVIGDCYGVDIIVQEYLASKNYQQVTVYHIGKEARNNAGYPTHYVAAPRQPAKNTEMAKVANFGLAIWDGRSRGTADAIQKMQDRGIRVKIIHQVSPEITLFCRVGTHPRPDSPHEVVQFPKGFPICTFCIQSHTPEELKAWNGVPNCPKRTAICSLTGRLKNSER